MAIIRTHLSGESSGRRLAKQALWSPFVGLFVMVLLALLGENREAPRLPLLITIYGFLSLFFAGGLAWGVRAWRRMKVEGQQGIKGRALTGIVLNRLLLCGTLTLTGFGIYFFAREARTKQQVAADHQKFVAQVNAAAAGFGEQLKNFQSRYQSSWAQMTNSPVLNMAAVKSREDLKIREQRVGALIDLCQAFLDFSENSEEAYRQEMIKQQLSPLVQKRLLEEFASAISEKNPQIILLRQTDVRRCKALLKAITFLDDTWGQWNYDPATNKIQFKRTTDAEQFQTDTREFAAVTDEVLRLKKRINSAN